MERSHSFEECSLQVSFTLEFNEIKMNAQSAVIVNTPEMFKLLHLSHLNFPQSSQYCKLFRRNFAITS